jgi:hypothetical protein
VKEVKTKEHERKGKKKERREHKELWVVTQTLYFLEQKDKLNDCEKFQGIVRSFLNNESSNV